MPRKYTEEQRVAQRARTKAHYEANKQYYKDKAKKTNQARIDKLREHVRGHFLTHPCVDCGNNDHRVLDFDHVLGEKKFNIADAMRNDVWVSLDALIEEIEKCEVRCANCHRIVTYERRNNST